VPALRQQTASARTAAGHPMTVTVEAPTSLPRLPAAVEVAAYRIATEAVTNSARHSGTDLAWICLELGDDRLTVTIRDPGPMTRTGPPASEYRQCENGPPKSAAPSRSPATRRDPRYVHSSPSADPGRPQKFSSTWLVRGSRVCALTWP
jgi:hypothetical protein